MSAKVACLSKGRFVQGYFNWRETIVEEMDD